LKIRLIRHGKVNIDWPRFCNSLEFDAVCKQYDQTALLPVPPAKVDAEFQRLYVSPMLRSIETAKLLFPEREYTETDTGEVPIRSFLDTKLRLPIWAWYVGGRLQWLFNSKRQKEGRNETVRRCGKVIEGLMESGEDCVIVTHGFFMKTFLRCLEKKGFSVNGRSTVIANLQVITAEKEETSEA